MPQARTEVGDITLITSITCVKFIAHAVKNSAKIDCATFADHVTCEHCHLHRVFMLMETPPCTIIPDLEMIQLVRGDKITLKLK